MNDGTVVLRKYASEWQAQLDASVLEANGVSVQVSADTAGGAYPSMALINPVRLLVRAEDAELAAEILDASADPAPDGEASPA